MSAGQILLAAGVLLMVVGLAVLRWQRPAWYWMGFGSWVSLVRLLVSYSSVMDACGLTVPASRFRLAMARWFKREVPPSRVPRITRLRITRTGLVLRVRLRPGQDAFDYSAAADRLRHSFGMQQVTSREVRAGVVELRMTGYDVLKRVQMPTTAASDLLRVPVGVCEDGSVHYRDYRQVPHSLTIGAVGSGKSVYQRQVIQGLASQPVALVGIDCKEGVELAPMARRLSAFADNPDDALVLLEALVERMASIYQVIRREQRISSDTPDAEITADIWGLSEEVRPVPVVITIDEVAELVLFSNAVEEKRAARIITALVRLAQLGRAAGIFLDIYGQRFGGELGKGITMLRAQLTGRTAHRVNDESSARMVFGDISADAVFAAIQIPSGRPGTAVSGDASGGWVRLHAPHTRIRQAATVCNSHAALTPDLPELAAFRPRLGPAPVPAPLAPVTEAA